MAPSTAPAAIAANRHTYQGSPKPRAQYRLAPAPDRILAIYEGEIVGELDPKTTTAEEMGLYMAGAKRKGA